MNSGEHMNSGEQLAFHYATREPVRVLWRDGKIISLSQTEERPATNLWLAPALFDLQINGYGGVDFQRDGLPLDQLLRATRALRRDGCGKFFFTLITDEWPKMMARLDQARQLRAQSPELQDALAGWHIEGPFLSEQRGFSGAHNPARMVDPTPEHLHALRAATGHDPVLLTLAPERAGAIDAIRLARALGMTVSLGHTDASAEMLRDAIEAGATGFTHLGNGCPRELDRHDNILWRVAETPGLTASFIPDGHHVSPAPFRLLHKLLAQRAAGWQPAGEAGACSIRAEPFHTSAIPKSLPVANGQHVYYTTDAMAAAGAGPGRYTLGNVEVEVGADQIVRQPGQTNFAGSALRPVEGVFRAAKMLHAPWQECWQRFSEAPAQLVGRRNEVMAGGSAPFCFITVNEANELIEVQTVCAHG